MAKGRGAKVSIGGKTTRLRSDIWRLWIGPEQLPQVAHHLRAEPETPIPWEEFGPFEGLHEVQYTGTDPGFPRFLESRPLVSRAMWLGHGQHCLDLARTALTFVSVEVAGPLELKLPESLAEVLLSGPGPIEEVSIRHPRDGEGLHLQLSTAELPGAITGLPRLGHLAAWGVKVADVERLAGYPELCHVELRGAPGELRNLGAFAKLADLRRVSLQDFYTLDPSELPKLGDWPQLDAFEVDGLRKADAAAFKEKLAGVSRLEIRGAKTEAWLKANIDNPFRDWVDRDRKLGRAACDAYRKASVALSKLGQGSSPSDVKAVLDTFVARFNAIDNKETLDTIDREEVADAYHCLLEGCAVEVDSALADEWLDSVREF